MTSQPIPLRDALKLGALAGPKLIAGHVTLSVVEGLLPLAGIWAMKLLVDSVAGTLRSGDVEADYARVLDAVWIAGGIAVVGALIRAVSGYVGDAHGRIVTDRCADRMLGRASSLDLGQIEDPEVLDLMQRAGQEAAGRPARIVTDLTNLLIAAVTLVSMGALLGLVDPLLSVVVVLAAVPSVRIRLRNARRLFDWQRETAPRQREVGYLSTLLSSRGGAKDLRAFGLAEGFLDRVRCGRTDLREGALALSARRARGELVGQVVATAALFFAYARLGWLAIDGVLGVGAFVMYAQAVQRTQNGVRDLLGNSAALSEHRLFLRTFLDFCAMEPTVTSPAMPRAVGGEGEGPQRLRFRSVGFAYPKGPAVLHDVDFEIAPGEKVALVGRNGSGKSTIVRLCARLHDPDRGELCYGEVSVTEFDLDDWRSTVSVLFQDACPLDLTVTENIDPEGQGSPESVRAAAAEAGALERIERLPQGFETKLGRRFADGQELSAGEWRRLLLARVLHRRSPFLVLDEPSAFLDPEACRSLGQRLRANAARCSVLVVDHRPEAVSWVDRVLLLERGRIVQEGTPTSLFESEGAFRALFHGPEPR